MTIIEARVTKSVMVKHSIMDHFGGDTKFSFTNLEIDLLEFQKSHHAMSFDSWPIPQSFETSRTFS